MKFTEDDIDRIEAGITARVARGSGQEKLPVREKRLKFRSDGIAEPVRIEEKEEPSARMLMPAVLRRSMDRSEVRSLIPGTRVGKRRT
jgi:hypothetical protein